MSYRTCVLCGSENRGMKKWCKACKAKRAEAMRIGYRALVRPDPGRMHDLSGYHSVKPVLVSGSFENGTRG